MPVWEFKDSVFEHFARVGGRPWGAPKRVEIVDLLAQGGRVPRASEAGGGVPRGSARVSTAFFDDVDGVEPAMIEELKTRIQSGSVRVVDVRPWLEFESGHLPGAANIPLGELSARMGELDTSTPVIALPRAVLGARGAGRFTATRRRRGCPAPGRGPIEWHAAGLPLERGASGDPSHTGGPTVAR